MKNRKWSASYLFLISIIFHACLTSTGLCRETTEEEYGGRTFYIDVSGRDTNDGTQSRPWKTLFHANANLKPGDTVLINPGRYPIGKKLSIQTSGLKGRPITIRGNGQDVVLDFLRCNNRNGFEIYFANYIVVENIVVIAPQRKGSRGIRLTHSTGSIIRNNTVSGAKHANLFCSFSDYTIFEHNNCYDGKIGIYVADSTDHAIVKDNLLHDNASIGLHMNGDRHSGGDGTISHATIENNIIWDNGATGINCDGVTHSVFRNNLLYNNRHRGIAFFKGNGAVPSEENLVIHNTIVMPTGAYYAIGLNYGAYENAFYNNLIVAEGNVPVFSTTGKASELKVSSDYNLFSKNAVIWEIGGSFYRFGKWGKKIQKGLNALSRFLDGKKNDGHSVQAESSEIFLNPQKDDYNLKPKSPAIDRGTPKHSFGKDLRGNIRPKNKLPDIGAYEYSPKSQYSIEKTPSVASAAGTQSVAFKAEIPHQAQKVASAKLEKLKNRLGMEFRFIALGSFIMGMDCSSETASSNCHQVNLTKGIYAQTSEVTQGQWKEVMGENPSFFKDCGPSCPVEQVSWYDAQKFISKLNRIEKTEKYRLPTEAEWEYMCRAGTVTPFSFGKCLTSEQANYDGHHPSKGCTQGLYREKPISVKDFPPNGWGLRGMHGNVWEWCEDWVGDYPTEAVTDPKGPAKGSLRVIRGGGWNSYAQACRSSNRSGISPVKSFANLGFRIVREP